jgi:outer membrane protein assembly factor BamE
VYSLRPIAPALLALLLSSCMTPYQSAVQQGNLVTQDMVDKLKPGMTRNQVRFVLGTPLITDPFHQERWDYVYMYRGDSDTQGKDERRHFAVIFERDVLKQVEGDIVTSAVPHTPDTGDIATDGSLDSDARAL